MQGQKNPWQYSIPTLDFKNSELENEKYRLKNKEKKCDHNLHFWCLSFKTYLVQLELFLEDKNEIVAHHLIS